MASRECVRLSAAYLEAITDNDDEDVVLDCAEKHGVPMDAAIHVVSVGNPHDGITLFGPFYTAEEAGDWAAQNIDDTWQVVTPQTGIW